MLFAKRGEFAHISRVYKWLCQKFSYSNMKIALCVNVRRESGTSVFSVKWTVQMRSASLKSILAVV